MAPSLPMPLPAAGRPGRRSQPRARSPPRRRQPISPAGRSQLTGYDAAARTPSRLSPGVCRSHDKLRVVSRSVAAERPPRRLPEATRSHRRPEPATHPAGSGSGQPCGHFRGRTQITGTCIIAGPLELDPVTALNDASCRLAAPWLNTPDDHHAAGFFCEFGRPARRRFVDKTVSNSSST